MRPTTPRGGHLQSGGPEPECNSMLSGRTKLSLPLSYAGPLSTQAALELLADLPLLGQGTYGFVFKWGKRALKLVKDCSREEEAGYARLQRLGVGPAVYEIQVLHSPSAKKWLRRRQQQTGPLVAALERLLCLRDCDCHEETLLVQERVATHCLVLVHLEAFDTDLAKYPVPESLPQLATELLWPIAKLLRRVVLTEGCFPFDVKPANVLLQLDGTDGWPPRLVLTDLEESTMHLLREPNEVASDAALLYFLTACRGSAPLALWHLPGWQGSKGAARFRAAWDLLHCAILPRGGWRYWTLYAVDALWGDWEAYLGKLSTHVKQHKLQGRPLTAEWLRSCLRNNGLPEKRTGAFWRPLTAGGSPSAALADGHCLVDVFLFAAKRCLQLVHQPRLDCYGAIQDIASRCCGGWLRLCLGFLGPLVQARFRLEEHCGSYQRLEKKRARAESPADRQITA